MAASGAYPYASPQTHAVLVSMAPGAYGFRPATAAPYDPSMGAVGGVPAAYGFRPATAAPYDPSMAARAPSATVHSYAAVPSYDPRMHLPAQGYATAGGAYSSSAVSQPQMHPGYTGGMMHSGYAPVSPEVSSLVFQRQVQGLQTEVDRLTRELEESRKSVEKTSKLKEENAELKKRMKLDKDDAENAQETLQRVRGERTALQAELLKVKGELSRALDDKILADKAIQRLRDEKKDLQRTISDAMALKDQISRVSVQVKEAHASVLLIAREYKNEVDRLEAIIADNQAMIDDLLAAAYLPPAPPAVAAAVPAAAGPEERVLPVELKRIFSPDGARARDNILRLGCDALRDLHVDFPGFDTAAVMRPSMIRTALIGHIKRLAPQAAYGLPNPKDFEINYIIRIAVANMQGDTTVKATRMVRRGDPLAGL